MNHQERKTLQKKANQLRETLRETRNAPADEIHRPMREVAIRAISDRLTQVGRKLKNDELTH